MRFILPIFLSFSFVFASFSCDDALPDKQRFFLQNLTFSGEFEPNCKDSILGIKEAQILLSAAQNIRAESLACVGNLATKNLNEFKFRILKASYAPEIYAKELESPDEYEKLVAQNRARLRYWGHQSLSNFTVFKDFNKDYNTALEPLVNYYKSNFKIDEGSAIYYASKVANEFLKFAAATLQNGDMDEFTRKVSDPTFTKYGINEAIYSGAVSQSSLQNAFNAALLYEKSEDVIREFLRAGVNLNYGFESSLFFALKNLNNVKLLVSSGADVNYANLLGITPLFKAVQLNDINLVKFLLENGALVNKRLIDVSTKLAYSSNLSVQLPSFVKLCDFDAASKSVLMSAAGAADVEILQLLVDNGADVQAVDDNGLNALDYAIIGKKEINAQYLRAMGLESNLITE